MFYIDPCMNYNGGHTPSAAPTCTVHLQFVQPPDDREYLYPDVDEHKVIYKKIYFTINFTATAALSEARERELSET